MSVINAVADLLRGTEKDQGDAKERPQGAYWCHDCAERIPDTETTADPPTCPECGDAMTFERTPDSAGCAC